MFGGLVLIWGCISLHNLRLRQALRSGRRLDLRHMRERPFLVCWLGELYSLLRRLVFELGFERMFQVRFGLLLGGRIGRLYQVRQWELLQRKFRCLRAVPLRALERFRAGGRVHTLRQGNVLPCLPVCARW